MSTRPSGSSLVVLVVALLVVLLFLFLWFQQGSDEPTPVRPGPPPLRSGPPLELFVESGARPASDFVLKLPRLDEVPLDSARVLPMDPRALGLIEALPPKSSLSLRLKLLPGAAYDVLIEPTSAVSKESRSWSGATRDGRASLTLVAGPAGPPFGTKDDVFYVGTLHDQGGAAFRIQGSAATGFLVTRLIPDEAQDCLVTAADAIRGLPNRVDLVPSRIDVLVAYTERALDEAVVGAYYLQRFCEQQVALTNSAFLVSGVRHSVFLKGTFLTGALDRRSDRDPEPGGLRPILDALDGPGTRMQGVHAERRRIAADVVVLLVSSRAAATGNLSGVARTMETPSLDFAPHAFAVVAIGSLLAVGSDAYTFTHELGHLFGCCHAHGDVDQTPCSGSSPSAHGWRFRAPDGEQLRTVMCYPPGRRVLWFSNPEVRWGDDGEPTGNDGVPPHDRLHPADNASVLNANGPIVAQFDRHLP